MPTLYFQKQFVTLHQAKPADYGSLAQSGPRLAVNGVVTQTQKYNVELSFDHDNNDDLFDYSEFKISGATFSRPSSTLVYDYYQTEGPNGGTSRQQYLIWSSVTVPDGFAIPPELLGGGSFSLVGTVDAVISASGLLYDTARHVFTNGASLSSLASAAYTLLPTAAERAFNVLGLSGLSGAINNTAVASQATSVIASGGINLLDAMFAAVSTGADYRQLDGQVSAYLDQARGATDAALQNVILIPGSPSANAAAINVLRSEMTTGSFSFPNLATAGVDIQIQFNGSTILTTSATVGASFVLSPGSAGRQITGSNAQNILVGGYGADTIVGGGGKDYLAGGAGNDVIYGSASGGFINGGAGNDIIVVRSPDTVIAEAADGGADIVYAATSYVLSADAEVEVLSTQTNGGMAAINLTGNGFSQQIIGNNGSNIINGGGGADTLIGLDGNDTYLVRGPGDRVLETNGGGMDIVYTTTSYNLGANEVEVLSTVQQTDMTPIDLTGNYLSQTIVGNYGNNILNGGSGIDTLIGLYGNDLYAVGDSRTVIVERDGQGADTVVTSVSYGLAAGVSVEVLAAQDRSSTVGLILSGNELPQIIVGTEGGDTIDGGSGADTLIGGLGPDLFLFSTALGLGNEDRIEDFQNGVDRLGLSARVFSALGFSVDPGEFTVGSAATNASQFVIYNQQMGQLFYDMDGSGPSAAVLFASVRPGTVLTTDSLVVV